MVVVVEDLDGAAAELVARATAAAVAFVVGEEMFRPGTIKVGLPSLDQLVKADSEEF